MRENEIRVLGENHWAMFSVLEPVDPNPHRTIDQSVVVWRNATRITKTGCSDYPNPRSVVQQKLGLAQGGSNCVNIHRQERRNTLMPLHSIIEPNNPNFFNPPQPYDPAELERSIIVRDRPGMMTADEVRRHFYESNLRSGRRYPSPAEVEEIQRRFHNPELEHAMEVARQELMRRYWPRNVTLEPQEYFERMTQMISEPAPPGFREAMEAVREIHAD